MLIYNIFGIICCVVPVLMAASKRLNNEYSLCTDSNNDPPLVMNLTSHKMEDSPSHQATAIVFNNTAIWPNNTVAYEFGKYTQQQKDSILEAMKHIEQASDYCVKFKHHTNEIGFVNFTVSIKICCITFR